MCLRQLVHSCWVDVVDLARCAYDGAAATGLSIYNCLGLREGLGLRSLDVHTADLVHQRREVLRAVRGNDLSTDLLQCVLGQRCLQHGGLTHDVGGRDALRVVKVRHLPRHVMVRTLAWTILSCDLALPNGWRLLMTPELLGAEPKEMCVLIVHISSTV